MQIISFLAQLGVVNESLRKCVLKELSKLVVPSPPSQQQQLSPPSPIISNTTTRLHNTDRLDETTTTTDGPMIRISKVYKLTNNNNICIYLAKAITA